MPTEPTDSTDANRTEPSMFNPLTSHLYHLHVFRRGVFSWGGDMFGSHIAALSCHATSSPLPINMYHQAEHTYVGETRANDVEDLQGWRCQKVACGGAVCQHGWQALAWLVSSYTIFGILSDTVKRVIPIMPAFYKHCDQDYKVWTWWWWSFTISKTLKHGNTWCIAGER